MSLNVSMEGFWDQNALNKEFTQQFYICHTCRLCFNLCPFFPALFDKVDSLEGDIKKISYESFQEMLNLCYQCKLCFLRCPYTPPHEFMIDIPRLALHAKAVKGRLRGVRLLDRLMGNTDRLGKFGSLTAPIANWAHRRGIIRGFMHKAIGVHRDRKLPLYHRKTFIKWFRENEDAFRVSSNLRGRVALFYTCYVNYNFPSIGRAVVEVLRHNDVEIICPRQKCCGMPFLDGGLLKNASKNAEFNVKSLMEAMAEGFDVVTIGPTCDYVLRTEYAHILKDKAASEALAAKSHYITEYLIMLHKKGNLNLDFQWKPGKIVYHMPCHLKAQRVGYRSLELLKLIPNAEVTFVDKGCSGIDGTWGFKKEYYELSHHVAKGLIQGFKDAQPAIPVTDCPLAGIQIEQGIGQQPLHPVQLLRDAYGIQDSISKPREEQ